MMQDTPDTGVLNEDEDKLEEEAETEVNNVLRELTDGTCGKACFLTQANSVKHPPLRRFQVSILTREYL